METVNISQGRLRGGKSKTDGGFEYYEFLGIPYAKPPVGNLRFKVSIPPYIYFFILVRINNKLTIIIFRVPSHQNHGHQKEMLQL